MARLHREVLATLIAEIVGGARVEGELLEREVDLAARFDVSRGVARECVRALEERGLVTVRHGLGAAVTAARDWNSLDPLVLAALLEGPERTRYAREALACCRLGEVAAAGLAATRASAAERDELRAAVAHLEACAERARTHLAAAEAFDDADVDVHRAIANASGNRLLGRIVEPIHRALADSRPQRSPAARARVLEEHRRTLDAIEAGDEAKARAAMAEHVDGLGAASRGQRGSRSQGRGARGR